MLSLLKPLINQGKRTTRIDEYRNTTSQTCAKAIKLISRLPEIPIAKIKSRNSIWITINRRISPISPLPPPASNKSSNNDGNGGDLQIVEVLSPPIAKYLHQKSQEMTLILRKVEIIERPEIFSVFLVKRLVINRLILQALTWLIELFIFHP
jgi:hypothetical protein